MKPKEIQMNVVHAYVPIAAVAAPFLAIIALNVFLAVNGERGTLLMPSAEDYPRVWAPASVLVPNPRPVRASGAANDASYPKAA